MPSSAVHFCLRIQHCKTSHSRTPFYRNSHSLAVRESGLALSSVPISQHPLPDRKRGCPKSPEPSGLWMVYCYIITMSVLAFLMHQCGGLWCRCYLSSHLLALYSKATTCMGQKMGFLSFILMAGIACAWDTHNKVSSGSRHNRFYRHAYDWLYCFRSHSRYCCHSLRRGCHVPMVLFVEIGDFS